MAEASHRFWRTVVEKLEKESDRRIRSAIMAVQVVIL